ncbi:MAG: hypothetical protein ACYCO3_14215, partial [Mycobacteriales bacterium]
MSSRRRGAGERGDTVCAVALMSSRRRGAGERGDTVCAVALMSSRRRQPDSIVAELGLTHPQVMCAIKE